MLGALTREQAYVLHVPRQPVALALQLLEAQQARTAERLAGGVASRVCRDAREGPGDDLRELALEPRDLTTQGATCGALVGLIDG
jgi:hypothetical protein